MDRLNPLDAQFVDAEDEDRHTSMAIASIAVFEGPAPTYDELLTHLRGRLPLVPRYRQKLRKVPFRLGAPVWVDDPDFDLRFHVRQTALPQPGGDQQLNKLMARVMGQRLDRDYPLWEYWLVQGLTDGRWALISKIHHCLVDGVSGTDLYRVIFDVSANPSSPPAVDDRVIAEPPSSLSLAAQAAVDMVMMPVREASALGGALTNPGAAVQQVTDMARAVLRMASSMLPATGSSLSGPIGQQRRYTWARASLDDVKTIKGKLGGTVNDVVLAAISGAFRDLLLSRGEEPQPFMMPSLVPVSVRAPGEENIYENRVSAILAYLPVHIADPVARLSAIRAEISALKASHESKVMETLVSLGRFTPYPVASVGVQLAYSLHQREIVTVTTNVPGPRQPLYGMGRRLVEIIPYVPIATTMRTGVSIFTYCGNVTFGITGDYASNPDIEVLARGIENGLVELLKAANQVTAPAAPPAGAPGPAAKASTPKPSTPKASTPKASTAKSSTPKASTAKASTAKASTAKPSTSKASTAKPSTAKPSTAKASTAKPSTSKASTAKPSTSKASTAKPSTPSASTAKPSTPSASTAKPSTPSASTPKASTPKASKASS
jgi:diacylglycerol O-acyltransferase